MTGKFRNYKDLYEKPCKREWVAKVVFLIQMLPTSAAVAIADLRYTAENSRVR